VANSGKPQAWQVRSALPGAAWPAIPPSDRAAVLALLFQLEQSQWLTGEQLRERQREQLTVLLRHARDTVPYYQSRWPTQRAARLEELPILARRELQEHFEALKSEQIPSAHGPATESRTSGATGAPVRVLRTQLGQLFWSALTLREHLWHERDFAAKLAVIRQGVRAGETDNWGPATAGLVATGPCVMLTPASSVAEQLEWLGRQRPAYLLTYPSNVVELASLALAQGVRLEGLREVRTIGESLGAETRALCLEAWGAPLTDFYSTQEVGYVALQCPGNEHYHVQAESVLVEVLDEQDRPCAPGRVGRVVVTDLHNFAMPLIRYELGDYAEVGEPCACGRGLPVLRRILGRVRNSLVTADGNRYWPTFGVRGFLDIAPVLQHQFVQKSFELVEARLVVASPLDADQEKRLAERIASRLPPGFRVRIAYRDRIPRSAGGKYEDFYSEVSAAAR